MKGAVAPGGCGHSNLSVKHNPIFAFQSEGHFLGRNIGFGDAESGLEACVAAGCHAGATPGDVNVQAPTLNDWSGDKGGYNTPFRKD